MIAGTDRLNAVIERVQGLGNYRTLEGAFDPGVLIWGILSKLWSLFGSLL